MEIYEMNYILVLAETKNFSRAAERLFITQSALSQQISKIEKEIGFPLFERNSRQVTLSSQGRELLNSINAVQTANEKLNSRIKEIKDSLSHRIRFGSSQFIGQVVSQVITSFQQRFPEIELEYYELFNKDLISQTSQGRLDLAIVPLIGSHSDAKFKSFTIRKEHVCAIVHKTHPLAAQKEIFLEDLSHYQLIFSSVRTGLRNVIMDALKDNNLKTNEPFDITSEATRMPFLRGGAITFSLSGTYSWVDNNEVIIIPLTPRIYSNISIIMPTDRVVTPAINELMNLLSELISSSPENMVN